MKIEDIKTDYAREVRGAFTDLKGIRLKSLSIGAQISKIETVISRISNRTDKPHVIRIYKNELTVLKEKQ